MQIKLNLQIFIFLIIFYFTKQIKIYTIIILFAIIHEFSHILIGILYGLKPKLLNITPFGISIYFEKYKKNGYKLLEKQKIIIALSGPLMNFILAITIAFFTNSNNDFVNANLLLAFFNLIPIYPLDGGKILKCLINLRKINKIQKIIILENITYISLIFLTILASINILFLQNISIFFIIIYLWYLVLNQLKYNKILLRIYKTLYINN